MPTAKLSIFHAVFFPPFRFVTGGVFASLLAAGAVNAQAPPLSQRTAPVIPAEVAAQIADRTCLGTPGVMCRADTLEPDFADESTYYGRVAMSHEMVYQVFVDLNVAKPLMTVKEMRRRMDRCERVFDDEVISKCDHLQRGAPR